MLFSFITITYNHQEFIIQHLNSIKYQIRNYGDNLDFEVIICDDCSTDNTLALIEDWINANPEFLSYFKVKKSPKNRGIVNNYITALKSFKGDFFKILAGDDIYSSNNLFDCVSLLRENHIIQGALLEFEGERIMESKKYYNYIHDFLKLDDDAIVSNAKRGKFIFRAPGFLFRKELITDDLIGFLKNFKMCEDRPLYFFLLTNNKLLKTAFYSKPIVLYRISESSIARNVKHIGKPKLIEDNVLFYNLLLTETKSLFSKLYLKYILYTEQSLNKRLLYKFNPISIVDRANQILQLIKSDFSEFDYYESMTSEVTHNNNHIKSMKD